MANKFITEEGKTKLLKLGFLNDTSIGSFRYLALGTSSSNAASTGNNFEEVNDTTYSRVPLEEETSGEQSITLSAIFADTNCNPSQGVDIGEIAIVDHPNKDNNDTFFAYAEVPQINKNHNISLKYTIIISIE